MPRSLLRGSLLVFNLLYLGLSKLNLRLPRISMARAVVAVAVIGLVSSYFIGGLLGFRSWTLTPLIDFENERVLMYFMTFLLSVLAYRQRLFAELPKRRTLYILAISIAWIPVTGHIFAPLIPFFSPEGFEITPVFRLIWHASFYLALVVMAYVMIESFRFYIGKSSSIWRSLSRHFYGVYIIHVIVIGLFGTLLLNTGLPALVKYAVLVISTYLGSSLLVSGYRSVKDLAQVWAARLNPSVEKAH